jgi:hypothetical protein
MHYIDLLLSFILFVIGILTLLIKRYRTNIWIVFISLIFFPVAIVTYYFPEIDPVIFGEITLLTFIVYPLVKVLILVVILRYISENRKREGKKRAGLR